MSINNTDPSTLFGGTWKQLKDRFLLGAGSTYTVGNTGGEATHILTISEIPSHKHSFYAGGGGYGRGVGESTGLSTHYTSEVGGDSAHNNMPPYLVVYMWKRTA